MSRWLADTSLDASIEAKGAAPELLQLIESARGDYATAKDWYDRADALFPGDNDLVVDTDSMLQLGMPGGTVPVEVSITAVMATDGRRHCFLVALHDLREQRRTAHPDHGAVRQPAHALGVLQQPQHLGGHQRQQRGKG